MIVALWCVIGALFVLIVALGIMLFSLADRVSYQEAELARFRSNVLDAVVRIDRNADSLARELRGTPR